MTHSGSLTAREVARQRLSNQHLAAPQLDDPAAVIAALGAVQSQDYLGARWAVGQRTRGATESTIEAACSSGAIVRTHLLRPTWHFVAAGDVRWLLALTAPRVHAANASMYRRLELDRATMRRARRVLVAALSGGRHRTRRELENVLRAANIDVSSGQRLAYVLMHAELDALVCSGPRAGRQFTYALLDERVPASADRPPDDALAELARRYLRTRGPADGRDFAWWSGLTIRTATRAIDALSPAPRRVASDGRTLYTLGEPPPAPRRTPLAHLLPSYDELFIGLRDRGALLARVRQPAWAVNAGALIANVIAIDGQLVGGWKRTIQRDAVELSLDLRRALPARESRAVTAAATRYAAFLGLAPEVVRL